MFLYFVLFVIFVSILIFFLFPNNRSSSNSILGIYRKNDCKYWPKYFIMLAILTLRNMSRRNDKTQEEFDQPQTLSEHKFAVDAVYFNGSAGNKQLLITNTARRRDNIVNGFLYLRVPEFSDQLLMSPKLPSTTLTQTDEEKDRFAAEGIELTPIIPMKKWSIVYNGKMKTEETGEEVSVKLKAEFKTKLPAFNFDTDMHPETNADAIAREIWSKEYFELLKTLHQTHFEQYGDIEGVAEINGKKYSLKMPSVRDHTLGLQRNWRMHHRYVLHLFSLDNGDRVTCSIVCIPSTFSRIVVGFVTKAKENRNIPIESCDMQLYQHGEGGTPPRDYAFSFVADKQYVVQVEGYMAPEFYVGQDDECRIVEMLCKFTVNGVRGWGAAEWQYLTGK